MTDDEIRARRMRERYVENVGREPGELPEDHPDRWQWEYRGQSPEDRERLANFFQKPVEKPQEEQLF
jgi:hypothetical protein